MRHLRNVLTAMSLLLCVATVWMWVRSYGVRDEFVWDWNNLYDPIPTRATGEEADAPADGGDTEPAPTTAESSDPAATPSSEPALVDDASMLRSRSWWIAFSEGRVRLGWTRVRFEGLFGYWPRPGFRHDSDDDRVTFPATPADSPPGSLAWSRFGFELRARRRPKGFFRSAYIVFLKNAFMFLFKFPAAYIASPKNASVNNVLFLFYCLKFDLLFFLYQISTYI